MGVQGRQNAARGVSRCEKSLRPGRIVAVDKTLLRAIDRHGFGIGCKPGHADFQLFGFLDRALEQNAAADCGAHGAGQRIGPAIAGHPHRRFDLIEAQLCGDGGVGSQLQRVVLGVRDMGLVPRPAARPQLGLGECQLEGGQHARHLR